jgi:hypothetical protein
MVLGTKREAIGILQLTYRCGYKRGWICGLVMGLAVVAVAAACIALVLLT